jgi:hypothetical protein
MLRMLHCNITKYVVTGPAKHYIKRPHKRTLTAKNGQVRGEYPPVRARPEATASGLFVFAKAR